MLKISRKYFILSILPAALIFLSLLVYPMIKVLYLSLTDYKMTSPANPNFVWFKQYIKILTEPRFLSAVWRTLYFSSVSVIITLVLGFAIAHLLSMNGLRGLGFFRAVVLVPMLITPLVAGSIFRFMYDYDYGIINYFITRLGMSKIPFLSSPSWALNSAIIADIWQWTPFAAIVLLAGLEALPKEPLEAAAIDGAGWWRTFFSIKIPLMRPIIGVVVLIRFMDAFREFDKIYILTSGGPGTASETMSVFVYRQAFQYFDTSYGAAAGVVMLFVVSILSMLYVRLTKTIEKEA